MGTTTTLVAAVILFCSVIGFEARGYSGWALVVFSVVAVTTIQLSYLAGQFVHR